MSTESYLEGHKDSGIKVGDKVKVVMTAGTDAFGWVDEFYQDHDEKLWPERAKEADPTGLEQHAPGAKLDSGKILAADILAGFARALWAVCELGTKGAVKYSLNGWCEVEDGERRYGNAEMRHKLKEWMGQEVDEEMDVLHATSEAWNALARLELVIRRKEEE